MPIDSNDLQVIIPYRQLVSLLNATQRVEALDKKMERIMAEKFTEKLEDTE